MYEYRNAEHETSHAHLFPTVYSLLLNLEPGSTVLDLGCGNGSFLSLFRHCGWNLYGVDSSESGIAIAKETYPEIGFLHADAEHSEAEILARIGKVDAIISTEVIEHVYAPRAFVHTISAILKPGGVCIITTPYHGYLKNLVLAVTGKLDRHFTVLWDDGHIKFWSRKTLTRLVEEAGLDPVGFRGSGRLPYLWNSMALLSQKSVK